MKSKTRSQTGQKSHWSFGYICSSCISQLPAYLRQLCFRRNSSSAGSVASRCPGFASVDGTEMRLPDKQTVGHDTGKNQNQCTEFSERCISIVHQYAGLTVYLGDFVCMFPWKRVFSTEILNVYYIFIYSDR